MHTRIRTWLQSSRRFYASLIVIGLLLLAVLALFQWKLDRREEEVCYGILDGRASEASWQMALSLSDYANEIFNPHVAALTAIGLGGRNEDDLRASLSALEQLPGVRAAYALNDESKLLTSSGIGPQDLADSLAACRTRFHRYQLGPGKYEPKFDHWLRNRVRFVSVPSSADTLLLMLCAFDGTGRAASIIPGAATYPALVQCLLVLDIDPAWLRVAVPQQMNEIINSREALLMWTPPSFRKDFALYGLGVLGLGDTLWWNGLKAVTRGYMSDEVGPQDHWLGYRVFYQLDHADTTFAAQELTQFRTRLAAADAAIVAALLLLLGLLVPLRRQWLARQTALTHLAHSLRTPVARLRLDVDTLLDERTVSPAQEREVAAAIGIECGRIERAVKNAALSLEDGGHVLNREPGNLTAIVLEALQPWAASFLAAGVTLQPPQDPPVLSGSFDRDRLITLLDNLLDNALRHTRLNGGARAVAVSLRAGHGSAILTVDDSGHGVPVADRARIFRRFERGSGGALTGASGLGLGLALVKEIAAAHGGHVSVETSPLGGARFTVILPLSVVS